MCGYEAAFTYWSRTLLQASNRLSRQHSADYVIQVCARRHLTLKWFCVYWCATCWHGTLRIWHHHWHSGRHRGTWSGNFTVQRSSWLLQNWRRSTGCTSTCHNERAFCRWCRWPNKTTSTDANGKSTWLLRCGRKWRWDKWWLLLLVLGMMYLWLISLDARVHNIFNTRRHICTACTKYYCKYRYTQTLCYAFRILISRIYSSSIILRLCEIQYTFSCKRQNVHIACVNCRKKTSQITCTHTHLTHLIICHILNISATLKSISITWQQQQ